MLEYLLFGAGYAFAAAVQPGPFQAFLLARAVELGWKRTLPAAFAPLLSDIPIILLVLFLLTNLTQGILLALKLAGGLLLLYLGADAFIRSRRMHSSKKSAEEKEPRTFLEAALINLLNPNPYLSWALIMGPAFLEAWSKEPAYGAGLVLSFYLTFIVALGLVILLFGTARKLDPRGQKFLMQVSAVIMAAIGLYQLGTVAVSSLG